MILYPGVFLSILIFILYRKSRILCSFGKKIVTLQPKKIFSDYLCLERKEDGMPCQDNRSQRWTSG